ncbi:hypothetical protein NP493_1251g00009 [Ridgeia piscesae]|uniref:Tyrosine-protein kinase ephrin type A/B receptor-like domain-containing protein n=1 Tax=Ridgeia piscesae TaxID=27915 RepID=A0AAD9KCE5_RIDPI|nr:hypothetical protein NP493_1251g00009 [Ridgeia piscesae]
MSPTQWHTVVISLNRSTTVLRHNGQVFVGAGVCQARQDVDRDNINTTLSVTIGSRTGDAFCGEVTDANVWAGAMSSPQFEQGSLSCGDAAQGDIVSWRDVSKGQLVGTSIQTPSLCDVNGAWGEWSDWSQCSRSCGGGNSTRRRLCDSPPPDADGRPCAGDSGEGKACHTDECPVCGKLEPPEHGFVNCSGDESINCTVACDDGYEFSIEPLPDYYCGPDTAHRWSHQTEDNPRARVPDCAAAMRGLVWAIKGFTAAVELLQERAGDGNFTVDVGGVQYSVTGQNVTGNVSCGPGMAQACNTGTYEKNHVCTECGVGFFQDLRAQTSCKECPSGYMSAAVGMTSAGECNVTTTTETPTDKTDEDSNLGGIECNEGAADSTETRVH